MRGRSEGAIAVGGDFDFTIGQSAGCLSANRGCRIRNKAKNSRDMLAKQEDAITHKTS